jgi:hypothetical protein
MRQTFAIGIGGAAGQGVATPGDIFAKIFSRRGRFKTLSSITNSTGHEPSVRVSLPVLGAES